MSPIGVRRLWVLVRGLPLDSALARSYDPEGAGVGWSLTNHLLATVAEVSDDTNAILATVYGKPGSTPPKPLRIDRPGRRPERPKLLKGSSLAAAIRRRTGGLIKVVPKKEG